MTEQLSKETNNKIFERNMSMNAYVYSIPSTNHINIKNYQSFRPTSTKYTNMMVLDNDDNKEMQYRNCGKLYNNYIDDESTLRQQHFALQNNIKSKWIPDSNGPLFNNNNIIYNRDEEIKQSFPMLFQTTRLNDFNPNPHNLGYNVFNNHTKLQVKDIE